jgi:thiol-disulfide isomerase/thioredoxin
MFQKITILVLYFLVSCAPAVKESKSIALNGPEPREVIEADSLRIPVYDFEGMQSLLHQDDGVTYVVNFWATWCAPCVKEMPYFEQVASEYEPGELQVILVNLDMPRMWESHLVPFVKERKLKSHVLVLDDPDQNTWIPKVDEGWSGAIPATLIYREGVRRFYEQPFTYEQLKKELSNFKS